MCPQLGNSCLHSLNVVSPAVVGRPCYHQQIIIVAWTNLWKCFTLSDIDECSLSTVFCHQCTNTPGSFTCVCDPGFILKNSKCEGQPQLMCAILVVCDLNFFYTEINRSRFCSLYTVCLCTFISFPWKPSSVSWEL